jgi:hypothetical protein
MKFNGPAPELINGRLAMIGILAAATQEVDTGATVLQQALQASPWLYAVLGLWVYASLVPILKGVRHEAFGEWGLAGLCICFTRRVQHGAIAVGSAVQPWSTTASAIVCF